MLERPPPAEKEKRDPDRGLLAVYFVVAVSLVLLVVVLVWTA